MKVTKTTAAIELIRSVLQKMKLIIAMGAAATMSVNAWSDAEKGCDLDYGSKLFSKCQVCHSTDSERGHGAGPNLAGVFGRQAGSVEGYKFSRALRTSDIVWSKETLNHFLAVPAKAIPRNRMAFAGIKNEKDREAIVCFLKSKS